MITYNVITYEEFEKGIQELIRLRNDPTRDSNRRRMIDNKLPEMKLLDAKELEALKQKYDYVIEMMKRYLPEGADTNKHNIAVTFYGFHDGGGYQFIAEGSVSDLNRPERNEYNVHLQNTSQWLFAFGLVFDTERRDFSVHT